MEIGKSAICLSLAAVFFAYCLCKAVYNLWFHPLAKFPGPWWAGVSYLPEFYYDVIEGGRYFMVVKQLHETYGPLIRVNPNELHFNDPYFYSTIYAGSKHRRDKDSNHAAMSGVKYATNVTIDHDLHRQRRGYIAGFFGKQTILRMEPLIQGKVEKLVQKLRDAYRNGETVTSMHAFIAATADVITHYAYGESFGQLDKDDLSCPMANDMIQLLLSSHFRRFLPFVVATMRLLPKQVIKWLNPAVGSFFGLEDKITALCVEAIEGRKSAPQLGSDKTIFDALAAESIPLEEKTLDRLKDESILVLFAGLDTTGRFLTAMLCYMLTYPDVLTKLRSELHAAALTFGDHLTWTQLEGLPYLTAFINESFRLNSSFTGRFPRVPLEPVPYKQWMIPAGTSVGAIPWLLNHAPAVFPEPLEFRPERWLEAQDRGENLTKYLVTFSKGARGCAGINLAQCEIYLTVAAIVMNFNFELVDSSIKNIEISRDYALGFDEDCNFGVKFKVTEVLCG